MKRFIYIRRMLAAFLVGAVLTTITFAEETKKPDTPVESSNIAVSSNSSSDSTDTDVTPDSSVVSQPQSSSKFDSSETVHESSSSENSSNLSSNSSVPLESEKSTISVAGSSSSAKTSSKTYQPTPTVSPEWNEELNTIYNNACDWLKQNQGDEYFFVAMGGAGMPIDSKQYSFFLSTVSSNTYTDLYKLSLTAINATFSGINADNVNGTDLISQIANFISIKDSSTMGLSFALLALDSNPYKLPDNAKNNRMDFVNELLKRQQKNGSFLAENGESTLAVTALSLSALSKYGKTEHIKDVLNNGVNYLQTQYSKNRFQNENMSTISRIISALSCLKININDSRFATSNRNFVTQLKNYIGNAGGFHSLPSDNKSDLVSTELAVIALTSVKYFSSPYVTLQSLPDSSSSQAPFGGFDRKNLPLWAIISIVIGGIATLGGGAIICLLILKNKKKKGKNDLFEKHDD